MFMHLYCVHWVGRHLHWFWFGSDILLKNERKIWLYTGSLVAISIPCFSCRESIPPRSFGRENASDVPWIISSYRPPLPRRIALAVPSAAKTRELHHQVSCMSEISMWQNHIDFVKIIGRNCGFKRATSLVSITLNDLKEILRTSPFRKRFPHRAQRLIWVLPCFSFPLSPWIR